MDRQRIDKWLWHARVVRTRSAAAALVDSGIIRINGLRVDAASRSVRAGDVVTVAFDPVKVLKVTGFAERRGSATDAAALSENLSPPPPKPAETGGESGPSKRPGKRERQEIIRLKRPESGD